MISCMIEWHNNKISSEFSFPRSFYVNLVAGIVLSTTGALLVQRVT